MSWDFLSHLVPPGMDSTMKWRSAASLAILVLMIHAFAIRGWLPGVVGMARADDIDTRIEARLEPIQRQLNALETQSKATNDLLKASLLSQYTRDIRAAVAAKCATTDSRERERIDNTIESFQQQYESVADKRYALPRCDEI